MYRTIDSVTKVFLAKDTLNASIMKLAIKSYLAQRKMAEAAGFTKNWLLTGETDPRTTVSLAQSNYSIKQYEACYNVCNNLLEQGIETEALFYYASQAKYKLNEFVKSTELLKQCLNLAVSKNTNLYYFSLADNFESLKQYKKAISSYDTAFYLFHDPLALYNIGRLYEQGLKNPKTAKDYYKKYMAVAKPKSKDEQKVYAYVKELLKEPVASGKER
jgi:tetratricopeptide (TPR) repeat protein